MTLAVYVTQTVISTAQYQSIPNPGTLLFCWGNYMFVNPNNSKQRGHRVDDRSFTEVHIPVWDGGREKGRCGAKADATRPVPS